MSESLAGLTLERFPPTAGKPLRAWDAADEYILDQLQDAPPGRTLILDDGFGALTCALADRQPVLWSDSEMTRRALLVNLEANGLELPDESFLPADRNPAGPIDLALIKLPRSLAHLEDSLLRLRPALAPGARIITGGMIKHTPRRAYELLEEILGPTSTSLGRKKARLAFSTFDPDRDLPAGLPPSEYALPEEDLVLRATGAVFSADHLDVGTGRLLAHLPRHDEAQHILDVGCGNGVLALVAARRCPNARVHGVDESHQAVSAARANADSAGLPATFAVAADLKGEPRGTYDLILCNPPFHQGQVVGDTIAWDMFRQIKPLLVPGGRLLVVGNRHLGYHVKLEKLFGGVRVVDSDAKFVVLESRTRP